jgi:hypothetical protein
MRRHSVDWISLLFGIAFAGLGVLFLSGGDAADIRFEWLWPLVVIALGIAIATAARSRPGEPPEEPGEGELPGRRTAEK